MPDPQHRTLTPAERPGPDPTSGWRGADLSDEELVDDAHIEADPDSYVIHPGGTDGA